MRFAYPAFLWLLALIPALSFWRAKRRGPAIHFPDGRLLDRLPASLAVRMQPLFPLLVAAAATCLIIALARPQKGLTESRIQTDGVDLVVLLDLSTSMEAADFVKDGRPQPRIDGAKHVLRQFIERRPYDRIGLVGFAGQAYSAAPLTLDHGWLLQRLDTLHTRMIEPGTAIGDAIATGANRLRDSDSKSRVLILLTDGINNRGSISPENAALAASALGIRIYPIGIGGGAPLRRGFLTLPPEEIDEAQLRRIAEMSGGEYFAARDHGSLEQVLARIDALETSEIQTLEFSRYEEKAGLWLIAALVLLTGERVLALSGLGRFPE